jgi:hypothetical protein
MILSLAFVEESCIINYFNAIKQYLKAKYINSDINKNIINVIDNFENNFINNLKGNHEIKTWNATQRLISGCALTINSAEGWNRFLNNSFRESHPSLLSCQNSCCRFSRKMKFYWIV